MTVAELVGTAFIIAGIMLANAGVWWLVIITVVERDATRRAVLPSPGADTEQRTPR